MNKTRPFLKWAGNKYRCLDHILPHLPEGKRLIEPFSGSAAVFLNTEHYDDYVLAEKNKDLVLLFQHIQRGGERFINYCEQYFTAAHNCQERYYQHREIFNQLGQTKKKAALFLYLNRHGYNGLCRYNLRGGYNVPFGRYRKPYFPRQELMHFYARSQQATFLGQDFRQTFAKAQASDIIYCDPPYAPREQTSNFSAYTNSRFGIKEQVELANLARQHAEKGGVALISNHDTPFIREQYAGADLHSFPVRRSISCNSENRGTVKEVLAVFS